MRFLKCQPPKRKKSRNPALYLFELIAVFFGRIGRRRALSPGNKRDQNQCAAEDEVGLIPSPFGALTGQGGVQQIKSGDIDRATYEKNRSKEYRKAATKHHSSECADRAQKFVGAHHCADRRST